MKNYFERTIRILILAGLVVFAGCSKDDPANGGGGGGGGTQPPGPTEANLAIAINPDPGTGVAIALAANYSFQLLISSTPPKDGVKIDITGIKESDNSTLFTQSSQTSSSAIKTIDLAVQNLQPGILYIIKVEVTSLTTASNKSTLSFKVSRK